MPWIVPPKSDGMSEQVEVYETAAAELVAEAADAVADETVAAAEAEASEMMDDTAEVTDATTDEAAETTSIVVTGVDAEAEAVATVVVVATSELSVLLRTEAVLTALEDTDELVDCGVLESDNASSADAAALTLEELVDVTDEDELDLGALVVVVVVAALFLADEGAADEEVTAALVALELELELKAEVTATAAWFTTTSLANREAVTAAEEEEVIESRTEAVVVEFAAATRETSADRASTDRWAPGICGWEAEGGREKRGRGSASGGKRDEETEGTERKVKVET